MKLPLPVPLPPSGLPAASRIESSSARSKRMFPFPVPVAMVTALTAPLPETLDTLAPLSPVVASVKSAEPRPVTASLNVTVKRTDANAVGLGSTRTLEKTDGGVLSIVYDGPSR